MSDASQHYHLVGVAGVGMSALAQVMLARGWRISGSDRFLDQGERLDVLDKLARAGVRLVRQDGSGVTRETQGVIASTAIEPDNPDLIAASRLGVPVVHRAAMLARLAEGKTCVAVAGTSGKTTITGMIGWILEQLDRDPTVVNGGVVLNWKRAEALGSVRIGRAGPWVLETDESDRSLLQFRPDWAVLANISRDHFELGETVSLFGEFVSQVRREVVCGPGVVAALGGTAGGAATLTEVAAEFRPRGRGWSFPYRDREFEVPLIGRHNAENALLAVALCAEMGLDLEQVRAALRNFRGIERRLEVVGEGRGVTVIDDYAHNPAKIRAAWAAAAERGRRVLGVWRPHGYGPLAAMQHELQDVFRSVVREPNRLFILPVFYAGGTAARKVTSEDLVQCLRKGGVDAEYAGSYNELLERLLSLCRAGDVALFMGARDPALPRAARDMARRLGAARGA